MTADGRKFFTSIINSDFAGLVLSTHIKNCSPVPGCRGEYILRFKKYSGPKPAI